MSDAFRSTRKNPTAGARSPTTAPVASARRMNSRSSMVTVVVVVRRVVPHAGKPARRTVVDDPTANEDDPVDDVLDGAELVRDVEDRDAELRPERLEEVPERLLRGGVD